MSDVVLGIAVGLNLMACGLNLWNQHRRERIIKQQGEQLVEFSQCVAMVVFLSTPESGAPESLQATCRNLIPRGVKFTLEKGLSSRVH